MKDGLDSLKATQLLPESTRGNPMACAQPGRPVVRTADRRAGATEKFCSAENFWMRSTTVQFISVVHISELLASLPARDGLVKH